MKRTGRPKKWRHIIECECCGRKSKAQRSTKRYCGGTCRRNAQLKRDRAVARKDCTCVHCGAPFTDSRLGRRNLYCGKPCRLAVDRQRRLDKAIEAGYPTLAAYRRANRRRQTE